MAVHLHVGLFWSAGIPTVTMVMMAVNVNITLTDINMMVSCQLPIIPIAFLYIAIAYI